MFPFRKRLQNLYSKFLIKFSTDNRVKVKAICSLDDPTSIYKTLLEWNNQDLYFSFFSQCQNTQVKLKILSQLKDLDLVLTWLDKEESPKIRYAIITKLADTREIISLLLNEDISIVVSALNNLVKDEKDQLTLINIYWKYPEILKYIEQCKNQAILQRAACFGISNAIRQCAFNNVIIDLLPEIAKLTLLRTLNQREDLKTIVSSISPATLLEIMRGTSPQLKSIIKEVAREKHIPLLQDLIVSSNH